MDALLHFIDRYVPEAPGYSALRTTAETHYYWPYLLSGLVAALIAALAARPARDMFAYLFPAEVYRTQQFKVDATNYLVSATFRYGLVTIWVSGINAAVSLIVYISIFLPAKVTNPAPMTSAAQIGFDIANVVAIELAYYWVHRAQHQIPALWELHKTHHSASTLNPFVFDRVHPLELIIQFSLIGFATLAVYTAFALIYGPAVHASILWKGLGAYGLLRLSGLWFLRHTHVRIGYGPLFGRLVISPEAHQLHHSAAADHRDRNFACHLALLDVIFGTYAEPADKTPFRFGIGPSSKSYDSLRGLYLQPIGRLFRQMARR